MKKTLLSLALALLSSLSMSAKDYTDTLAVTVNGSTTTQTATISVDKQADGRYNFALKNFKLNMAGAVRGIGNIELKNLVPATSSKGEVLATDTTITISNGDDKSVAMWMGPMLGQIPLQLKTLVQDDHLYTVIDINMASLNQVIHVTFGDRYQLSNSGFEDYRTEQTLQADLTGANPPSTINVEEPLNWHSFASATGKYVQAANAFSAPHTYSSDVVRPNSTGKKSLLLTSASVLGITIANGTITTGRMQAGDMNAANTKNCAFLSTDSTSTDSHGDPFYALMDGTPDSLSVWVKFKQQTHVADHPYATVSAALTDGTYYQDPQDKDYTNVVATAKNAQIASNGFAWQHIVIPFKYNDNNVKAKALLVTISTNADPGQGSPADSLYVDDISLIYNVDKPAVTVNGHAVTLDNAEVSTTATDPTTAVVVASTANKGSFAAVSELSSSADQRKLQLLYCSDDLKTIKTYTLVIDKGAETGISQIKTATNKDSKVYDLNGREVKTMHHGNVYILNGKKVLK
ncbi:calycin-like domain-containing protein [Hallella absiana]|uniref:calycin-like domain-containing protein n=1 Tax=Hallella absiana TaxID=2925336 RepID=UPI0021C581AE|nr:calycin-like domain-containing protein [Hallella absiana]